MATGQPQAGATTGRFGVERGGASIPQRGLFEQFLEFAPDAIVCVDRAGRVVIVNQQTERVFGYARGEIVGEPVEMLMPERFREQHGWHRAAYFEDPGTRPMGASLALCGRRRDGSEFPAEISLSAIRVEGDLLGIAAVRDVSERVESEREKQELIAQMEREKQRDQASRLESIGQLAGGVAHDFNNLLGVILNYADFVAKELEQGTPAHTDVLEIRRAAERATELTRQLLIFSRRESVEPQPLDLNEVVSDMERLLRRTLGEHIELHVELASQLPRVLGDAGQLQQVLVNLAVNARDAMPRGGRLRIETSSRDGSVNLCVADTGSGMPPEVVARAFEPFFSTKRKGEGTGLGLATVYGIVTAAGGEIEIDSEPGRGTTFVVELPASDSEEPSTPAASTADAARGHGEHVLVVEDEEAVRTLATRILTEGGYRVTAVNRGSEALTLLEGSGQRFDLLLTDVVMPEIRGVELAGRVREMNQELPILMMSGYTTPISDEERDAITKVPLLEKPFSGPALLHQVQRLLASRKG